MWEVSRANQSFHKPLRFTFHLHALRLVTLPRSFDPLPDELNIVHLGKPTIHAAEMLIAFCEECNPVEAKIPFDWLLDYVTGQAGATTDYILERPATCPSCKRRILEKTLVEPDGDGIG
jgi:hypothetical protein